MESTVTATDLARKLGDVLARVRYRGDTFIVEKNGVPVARVVPIEPAKRATLADGLAAWTSVEPDPEFADILESVGAADRTPRNQDDSLKTTLRLRAARHGRSMEEEARQLLREALVRDRPSTGLGSRISRRFTGVGGVDLPDAKRSVPRQPPTFPPGDAE